MCYLQIVTILPHSFQYRYPLLMFFFSYLIGAVGTSSTVSIEVVRVGIHVLFPNLSGRPSAFHYWVLCWLWVCHKWWWYHAEICSLYTHFGESFYHGCWILLNGFSVSIDMIMWFSSSSVDVMGYIDFFKCWTSLANMG